MSVNKTIVSIAYLPPSNYFSILLHGKATLEVHENYCKQSYRNRCVISGPNGLLSLSVPVQKRSGEKSIRDVRIAYDTPWQKIHWKSIESAYRSSPFFEYYSDLFEPYFSTRTAFLFDHNLLILDTICNILELDQPYEFSDKYIDEYPDNITDLRFKIHPKIDLEDHIFDQKRNRYIQVFDDRHGFIPNLSIIDMIFNTGPNTMSYLPKIITFTK